LQEMGFKIIIASSFGDIFTTTACKMVCCQ
ncbi:MAG: hypothetical protein FI685_02660, partial [SAR202 cluster bacterium]|nr:hypothetical protein [SAR202 cluster bacterium]